MLEHRKLYLGIWENICFYFEARLQKVPVTLQFIQNTTGDILRFAYREYFKGADILVELRWGKKFRDRGND